MEDSPAPSTSQNQQRQTAPATGPQIRSRITVVCAECKRLKLKCDRRAPCGSCTKRDTVARCIYSPAAAEKVDLHSLNNRLIQVEALLASILGQNTSPFSSTNSLTPSNLGNGASTSGTGNMSSLIHAQSLSQYVHHHHSAATTLSSDSIGLTAQDVSSIWLGDLGLGVSLPAASVPPQGPQSTNTESLGQIKLEPAPFDIELSRIHDGESSNVIDVDQAPPSAYPSFDSQSSTSQRRESMSRQSRPMPHILLPALSIYYPVPAIPPPGTSTSSSAAFPSRPIANSGLSSSPSDLPANDGNGLAQTTSTSAQYARPQVTPALLHLLPPLATCETYLANAHEVVFSVRPLPFENGWAEFRNRSIALLANDEQMKLERKMKRERREKEKEKAREARLARKIYFSGISGLGDTDMDATEESTTSAGSSRTGKSAMAAEVLEDEHSLPFFAAVCNVIAIGALVSAPSASVADAAQDTPSFLHALAQQALGVWDTAQAGSTQPQREGERLDYVLACLIGCGYLQLSTAAKHRRLGEEEAKGSSEAQAANPSVDTPLVSLVGRLVKAARSLDLGGETVSGMRRSGIALSVNTEGNTAGKLSRKEKEAEKERLKEEWKRSLWWEVMWYDLFTADALGQRASIPPSVYNSAQLPPCPAYPTLAPPPALFILSGDDDNEEDEDSEIIEDDMQGQRDFVAQPPPPASAPASSAPQLGDAYFGARNRLIQVVHHIKSRLVQPNCCCGYTLDQAAALESHVRQWQSALPAPLQQCFLDDSNQPSAAGVDKITIMQSCELAMIANLLIIRIYAPFLRTQAPITHAIQPMGTGSPSVNLPASVATTRASQAVIRAMKYLQSAHTSPEGRLAAHDHQKSDVLPGLFDIYPPEKVTFDAVAICAHAALNSKATSHAFDIPNITESLTVGLTLLANVPLGASHTKVVDALRARVDGSTVGALKRKHSQVDISSVSFINHVPPSGGKESSASSQPIEMYSNDVPLAPAQYHNQIIQLSPSSPIPAEAPVPSLQSNSDANARGPKQQERAPSSATPAPPSRARATPSKAEGGQKEKKAKRAPVVGIRVRPGKQPERSRALSSNAPQPLMTLAPRPLPSAESVRLQQQKLQLQTSGSKPAADFASPSSSIPPQDRNSHATDADMRSRSSSVSFHPSEQRPESINSYPPFFNQPTPTELSANHGAQNNTFAHAHQQQAHTPISPEISQGSYAQPMYDQPQPLEYRNPAFENTRTTNGTSSNDSMNYSSNVSSPFTNTGPPLSESDSPFTGGSVSSSGHPSTPSFTAHSSLPVFGPHPPQEITHKPNPTYLQIHTPSPFDAHYGPMSASYDGQHQQMHASMSLSDAVMDQGIGTSTMYASSSRQQQQQQVPHHHQHLQSGPFEMKGTMEHQSQVDMHAHHSMQHQHQQQQPMEELRRADTDHDMAHQSHHGSMDMAVAGPWPGPNHPQVQENPPPLQHAYQWNNGGQYQFYH